MSRRACSAARRPTARRLRTTDGSVAPDRASKVPKSASALINTRSSAATNARTTSSAALANPRSRNMDDVVTWGQSPWERAGRRPRRANQSEPPQIIHTCPPLPETLLPGNTRANVSKLAKTSQLCRKSGTYPHDGACFCGSGERTIGIVIHAFGLHHSLLGDRDLHPLGFGVEH